MIADHINKKWFVVLRTIFYFLSLVIKANFACCINCFKVVFFELFLFLLLMMLIPFKLEPTRFLLTESCGQAPLNEPNTPFSYVAIVLCFLSFKNMMMPGLIPNVAKQTYDPGRPKRAGVVISVPNCRFCTLLSFFSW